MPPPWRRFLESDRSVQTGAQAYARMAQAYENRSARVIPQRLIYRWEHNDEGRFEAELQDGRRLHARSELIAEHDGQIIRWRETPEAQAAAAALQTACGELPAAETLVLSRRDVVALLALCGEAMEAENVLCVPGRGGVFFGLFLSDIRIVQDNQNVTAQQAMDFPTLLNTPGQIAYNLTPQLEEIQAESHVLARVELLAADISIDYVAGRYETALGKLARAKALPGQHFVDQEPSGWLLACEAACQLELGNKDAASAGFREAMRCISPPDLALLLLGLARSAQDLPHSLSPLSACYIEAPERFAELASPDERSALTSWIGQLETARPDFATARESLLAALGALAQHNRSSAQLFEAARQYRKESHQIGPQDEIASRTSTAAYRELALKWMAPPVSSSSGGGMGYGEPADLVRLDECDVSDGVVDITAVFRSHSGSTLKNRYRMVRQPVPLSARMLWRLKAVWSIWPHEEIQLV